MNRTLAIFLFLSISILACTVTKPYGSTNKAYKKQAKELARSLQELPALSTNNPAPYQVATTNFNLRKPNYVIIHHTAQNACEQTLKAFTIPKSQVSAHYVICKDGTVHHMLNDYFRAWHGGIAKWGTITDINSVSLGIELDNNGTEDFAESQLNSLILLLSALKKTYNIPVSNFIGHSDIAPTRKQDPSVKFPWKKLADNGFGNWYDLLLDTVPTGFNHIQALKMIGYDVKDSTAAKIAFKRHFVQSDLSPDFTTNDKAILNNLVNKY